MFSSRYDNKSLIMVIYSIKDLETLSGVKAHTLRIWEKRYNIISPQRTPTNIRYYLDDDLRRILNIALLNRNGIKISKIAKMDPNTIQKKVAEITDVDESFEGQLDSLTISLIELDEEKFVKLMDKNIEQRGCVETMLEVIYPLLDKLALMWISGSIKSVHEKFVSHLIERKCNVEIDKTEITRDETFLIYLPKGESNSLSLQFLHFIIRTKGFRVINIGHDVSLLDILEVVEIRKPDFIFTIINDSLEEDDYKTYIGQLCNRIDDVKFLMSGLTPSSVQIDDAHKDRVEVIASSEETIKFLESL